MASVARLHPQSLTQVADLGSQQLPPLPPSALCDALERLRRSQSLWLIRGLDAGFFSFLSLRRRRPACWQLTDLQGAALCASSGREARKRGARSRGCDVLSPLGSSEDWSGFGRRLCGLATNEGHMEELADLVRRPHVACAWPWPLTCR